MKKRADFYENIDLWCRCDRILVWLYSQKRVMIQVFMPEVKDLSFLKKNGLLYKKKQNIKRAEITILGELPDNDIYDFILLTVRENQLYEALSELKKIKKRYNCYNGKFTGQL